jgi:hypothetical protein
MERPPQQVNKLEANPFNSSIEKTANFEGNWSELLFTRVQNPIIQEQIIDLLSKEDLAYQDYLRNESFTLDFVQDNGNRILRSSAGKQIAENELEEARSTFRFRTREQIEKEFDDRLAKVMSFTAISFDKTQPTSERMTLNWDEPYSGKPLNARQMSIAEAHEKGHVLRPYHSNYYPMPDIFTAHFLPAFDIDQVKITDEDIRVFTEQQKIKEAESNSHDEEYEPSQVTEESLRSGYLQYYLFNALEIAERMAQLKNYFGMSGADQFTAEHLAYAREHYLQDTGLDNGMTHFFQAITPETEGKFIELINSSGI